MTLENGLATPTMKIKRQEVRKYFKHVIDNLYCEVDENNNNNNNQSNNLDKSKL
jgi:hypothetical protein